MDSVTIYGRFRGRSPPSSGSIIKLSESETLIERVIFEIALSTYSNSIGFILEIPKCMMDYLTNYGGFVGRSPPSSESIVKLSESETLLERVIFQIALSIVIP